MLVSTNLLTKRRKYLLASILVMLISIIFVAFSMADSDDFAIARREVLLRRIGHEVLLQSGDSTSRVLPVKKVAENEYQISFENELNFQTEALVNTTGRLLAKDPLTSDYVVKVINSVNSSVAYSYAISKNKKNDIVTCIGRRQPSASYMINIKFKPAGIVTATNGYLLLGSLPFLAFVGFMFFRSVRPRKALPGIQHTGMFNLGSILFDAASRKLMINENILELTRTESRVLRIFALSPNEIIERSRLQKEIWEDEGVIVGRSLDMFISKLRKKLELDPNIKIVVIRGKGYKFQIST